jgi:hypothetical protein
MPKVLFRPSLPELPNPNCLGGGIEIMSNLEPLAIHLIQQGHWDEAVGLYRDELGLSLRQAEQIVRELAEQTGLTNHGRTAMWLILAAAGLSLFGIASVAQYWTTVS